MTKKAQGISINTIIIAAIALIVLVVLVAVFTGRLGGFISGVESCQDKGGTCKSYLSTDTPPANTAGNECGNAAPLRGTECENPDKFTKTGSDDKATCCVPLTT